jgi:cellulose synthase/poly-beta-1,6-N-acetylglucosamine synthase-like glycosyltransferase
MRMSNGLYLVYLVLYLCALPFICSMLLTSLSAIVFLKTTRRLAPRASRTDRPGRRFLIVIPAHNEHASISETVRSCLAIDYPRALFDVLVIADNCTDGTASRAREEGARVVERFDATRKSKGHALEYLIDSLEKSGELDTLDALVIIDADSTALPNLLEQFALGIDRGSTWMQCYDCVGNPDRSWRTRLMAHGFSLFNGITLAGRQALGLSASLCGNGMCLTTAGLKRIPWKAHGLVEDLEYSWTVRIAGGRIDFIKDTTVFATMLSKGGTPLANQRRRWEFGRSALRREMLGPLLHSPHLGWLHKAAAVVELASPPTSHIVLVYLMLSGLAAFAIPGMIENGRFYAIASICALHFVATLGLIIHALSPFLTSLLPWRFALSLGCFPYYVFWRLRVLAQGEPNRWIPTERECEKPVGDGNPDAARIAGVVSEAVSARKQETN